MRKLSNTKLKEKGPTKAENAVRRGSGTGDNKKKLSECRDRMMSKKREEVDKGYSHTAESVDGHRQSRLHETVSFK